LPELNLKEILEITGGESFNMSGREKFSAFEFDTRNIVSENTLFFALNSDNSDGHHYVPRLTGYKGAGAVVSRSFDRTGIITPLIAVDDTLKAAHSLASHVRDKFRKIKYIGITGSAGKTTTKEFTAQILSSKYRVFRSFKNWNNWIGLPFSLLKLKGDEEFAVFELAMSYPGIGEIDLLADILRPDIAMILNVFPVHMEFLKTLKNVARGKAEIMNYLDADGIAFISGDSGFIKDEVKSKKGRKIYFGRTEGGNDIILRGIGREGGKSSFFIDFFGLEERFETNLVNKVQIENLFAAIIIAQRAGMKNFEISEAVRNITPVAGRGEIYEKGRFTIIDETYNSNPEALKKTLEWVNDEFEFSKIAILGDMLELGEEESGYHFESGKFFSGLDYKMLITVGERSRQLAKGAAEGGFPGDDIRTFNTSEEAGRFIKEHVTEKCVLLFKASRGIRLEKAINRIENG